jgi:hypothetical protein
MNLKQSLLMIPVMIFVGLVAWSQGKRKATEEAYESELSKAALDVVAIDNIQAWHAQNDDQAARGLGYKRHSLERRTRLIADEGTRKAGQQFLASLTFDESGDLINLDRGLIQAIDPEKLKRWAAIAIRVLEFAEPFVPPPYNLAVRATIVLLKLYLVSETAELFGPDFH